MNPNLLTKEDKLAENPAVIAAYDECQRRLNILRTIQGEKEESYDVRFRKWINFVFVEKGNLK